MGNVIRTFIFQKVTKAYYEEISNVMGVMRYLIPQGIQGIGLALELTGKLQVLPPSNTF